MSTTSGHNGHGRRGRHKKRTSPETKTWEREYLLPPCPAWMPPEVYRRLAEMRNQ
jgi:hypothetical protein